MQLAVFKFTGKWILWFLIAFTQTIPWVIILVPYYITVSRLGLVNSLWTLGATYLAVFSQLVHGCLSDTLTLYHTRLKKQPRSMVVQRQIFLRIILPLSITSISAIV